MTMPPAIRLLRPKQWSKGLIVFAALLFTNSIGDVAKLSATLLTFAAISLVSSAVYVFNDFFDRERDRAHPVKKLRPLASGQVSPALGLTLGALCLAIGLSLGAITGASVFTLLVVYLGIQVAYNLSLKRIPVADVFVLSLGFVLRAVLGAVAIQAIISSWLLFCTGALALLLGFGKRRHEFTLQGDRREQSRESLGQYTQSSLDALLLVSAACAAMCYGIYCIDSTTAQEHPGLLFTSIFVFYGISRYLFLIFSSQEGGEPETLLLTDRHILASVVFFIITAALAMSDRLAILTGGLEWLGR
jgi:4-hydroxybenzoate polyprenyltransferase